MDCPNRILASLSSTDGAGQGSDRGRGETLKQARPFVAEHSGANRELSQRPIINRSGRVPLDHWSSGAQGRDRTTDTAIFSRMLYQLSYLGTSSPHGSWERGFIVRRACPVHYAQRGRLGRDQEQPSIVSSISG